MRRLLNIADIAMEAMAHLDGVDLPINNGEVPLP